MPSSNKRSKKKPYEKKQVNNNVFDHRTKSKRGYTLLNLRNKLEPFNKFFSLIPIWDKRLGLFWIRLTLVVIPSLLQLFNSGFSILTGIHLPTTIFSFYNRVFMTINASGWLQIILFMAAAFSLPVALGKIISIEKKLYNKVTKYRTISIFYSIFAVYTSARFFPPHTETFFQLASIILAIQMLLQLVALSKYQKEHGPYRPDQLFKRSHRYFRRKKEKLAARK
ncbi:hypothetical protein ACFP56_02490 [Paenibacillus septentrionalis]|uniref:Uncharacterized protein n=1 Tax=Paenibacillus septentrionalis TaxID=429342 RepID=A0ABW1UZ00_9BACL